MKEKKVLQMEKEYTSPISGYTGRMYGATSLSIQDKEGNEVFHTGFRNVHTYDELKETVDNFEDLAILIEKIIT